MNPNSFQSRYCARRGLTEAGFREDLLARALYPHARLLVPLIRWLDRQHFQADYEFIEDVGHLERIDAFHDALDSYVGHFTNRSFLRYRLRLRISARRMWRLVREDLRETPAPALTRRMEDQNSGTPFLRGGADRKPEDKG